jgi:hypothetical protein
MTVETKKRQEKEETITGEIEIEITTLEKMIREVFNEKTKGEMKGEIQRSLKGRENPREKIKTDIIKTRKISVILDIETIGERMKEAKVRDNIEMKDHPSRRMTRCKKGEMKSRISKEKKKSEVAQETKESIIAKSEVSGKETANKENMIDPKSLLTNQEEDIMKIVITTVGSKNEVKKVKVMKNIKKAKNMVITIAKMMVPRGRWRANIIL